MAKKKTYIYCNVLPANYQSPYFYICDFDVKPGDIVVIPIRSDNNEKVGLVLDANEYTKANAPYPPQWTKHVIRIFGENEPASLVKEKAKVDAEKAIRFKSDDQLEKIAVKEALIKYGVGKKKIDAGKAQLKEFLEKMPSKDETISDIIVDLSGGLILSADGKTVTGFKAKKTKERVAIRIPAGVETIEDNAFLRVEIDSLFLPKELKYLGKYTINHPYGFGPYEINAKNVGSIEVENGNEFFASDGIGFYAIEGGKKKLLRLLNKNLSIYTAPDDVSSLEPDCFSYCPALKRVILSESMESFDEYAFPHDTQVEEVFISKTVKHIRAKSMSGEYSEWNTVAYRIDEDSEYLFRDEDSIYEILDDGTYKLVTCFYAGKGKVLFLEGTSVIGAEAFCGHKNITKLEFPKSLRVIEEEAFAETGLKSLVVPDNVQRIESKAFARCDKLKSVQLSPGLEYIAENAFRNCLELEKIKTAGKRKAFSFEDGVVKKMAGSNQTKAAAASTSGDAVGAESSEESASHITIVPNKDYFAEFAEKIVQTITEESVENKDHISDRARYDAQKRVVYVIIAFSQKSQDPELVKERVDCAESLKENDPIKVLMNGENWEVTSATGKSLGDLGWSIARQAIPYTNFISIEKCTVASIMPKSQRRRNSKYALGSVKFEIREREITDSMSEQDLITRTQFAYSVDDKEAHLIKWIADASIKTAIIPSMIEGKPVISVNPGLFEGDPWTGIEGRVEEIVVSEGVKRLETAAFFGYNLDNLTKIVLPASIEYISPDVFSKKDSQCRDLYLNRKTVYVAPAGSYAEKFLKDYKPDHYDVKVLMVVNDDSVEAADELKLLAAFEVAPGDNGFVAKFRSYMGDDFKVTTVKVPASINGQPVETFDLEGIPNIVKKLVIPASVKSLLHMESSAFFYSSGHGLESVEVDPENNDYSSDGKAIFSKDKKTLLRFMSYKSREYTVPEGTETIGRFAFSESKLLKKLTLPKSIKKIDSHAFYDCEKLEDIIGMEYVAEVGEKIFAGEDWGDSGSIPYERKISVMILGSSLFKHNELSEKVIKVPDGITKICESAFGWENENDCVEEIILPESVEIIERAAFCGRAELKKINIPNGVKEICGNTFAYCEKLESLYIPASIEKIDISAFPTYQSGGGFSTERPCAFKAIEVDPANKNYCSVNGMLLSKDRTELLFIPNGVQGAGFEIPAGVKVVNDSLASNNLTITELVLPDSLTQIGRHAFSGCSNLCKLVLPAGLKSIGKNAFSGCTGLDKVVFPEGLEEIAGYAFSGCTSLKVVAWPKKLKSIGERAFYACGLEEVTFPDALTHIGSQAFAKTAIQKVTLPKSVQTLGWGAFSCVPEIEVYDCIDPDAKDADKGIDTVNGNPNSLVGYIGMGPAWAMWQCAANHLWVDYTITVKSTETDEIKYKVWMGADASQRDYYCFLSSAWGHNATFAFDQLDEFFPKIRGKENKLQVAKYRLEYPYELSAKAKAIYEAYVKKNS